jgi:hypothetical protein
VDALMARLSPDQWAEWGEFFRVEPFGFPAASNFAALLACVTANSAPFRAGEPVPLSRFLWRPGREPKADAPSGSAVRQMAASRSVKVIDVSRPLPR